MAQKIFITEFQTPEAIIEILREEYNDSDHVLQVFQSGKLFAQSVPKVLKYTEFFINEIKKVQFVIVSVLNESVPDSQFIEFWYSTDPQSSEMEFGNQIVNEGKEIVAYYCVKKD